MPAPAPFDDAAAIALAHDIARTCAGTRNWEVVSALVLSLAWHVIKQCETPEEAAALAGEWGRELVDNVARNWAPLKAQEHQEARSAVGATGKEGGGVQ